MECYSLLPLINRETQWDVLRTRVVSILQPMFLSTIFICTLVIMCFFFISAKGGINFERFYKLSSIWKMFLLKVSTCTCAVCTSLSMISLFPILCSIAFWPPLHCAIFWKKWSSYVSLLALVYPLWAQITFGVGSEFGSTCERKRIEPMFGWLEKVGEN